MIAVMITQLWSPIQNITSDENKLFAMWPTKTPATERTHPEARSRHGVPTSLALCLAPHRAAQVNFGDFSRKSQRSVLGNVIHRAVAYCQGQLRRFAQWMSEVLP